MTIKIQKREKPETLAQKAVQEALQWVPMGTYLTDSRVSLVGFSPQALEGIGATVRKSLERQPVHETGGFLLGNYQHAGQGIWEVSVLEFCPATQVADSSPHRLAFGPGAIQELDVAMEQAGGMEVVGWFHTHPGLTPYLSRQDMTIHEGFFREPWQIAIVLDCLTPGFDVGIFSRKANGSVNNKGDYPPGNWILWNQLNFI